MGQGRLGRQPAVQRPGRDRRHTGIVQSGLRRPPRRHHRRRVLRVAKSPRGRSPTPLLHPHRWRALALAGLYEFWRDPSRADDDDQRWVRSCTIITTRASQDMDGIHDRMPAVLGADTLERWLEPDGADSNELRALLLAPPPGTLVHHRVDPRVGNVRNDDAQLIEPLAASSPRQVPTEGGLFDPGND